MIIMNTQFDTKRTKSTYDLANAVITGNLNMARDAILKGAPLEGHSGSSQDHQSPLYFAYERGDVEMVKLLLDFGADLDNFSHEHGTCLPRSAKENSRVLILVTEARKKPPLHRASLSGNIYAIEDILSEKYRCFTPSHHVHERDDCQNTALHEAAAFNKIDVMKLLINAKADVNARDINGHTPLHKAIVYGSKEAQDYLLKLGAK